ASANSQGQGNHQIFPGKEDFRCCATTVKPGINLVVRQQTRRGKAIIKSSLGKKISAAVLLL
ncbi:hypothetical protein, partial [Microseira wollei]|uniref:hypothetical protein n=1 Tax=Microseira wollei TaxID=467598 RepID=UPI001CFD9464